MLDRLLCRIATQFDGVERYLELVRFILADSIGRYRQRVVKIVALSFLGSALELGAMFAIIFYASAMARNPSLDLFGITEIPRDSVAALVVALTLTWLVLVLASRITYRARVAIVAIGRRYEGFCARRVFVGISAIAAANPGALPDRKELLDLARKNSQVMGRVLRILMEQASACATLLLASAVLLYVAPALTGLAFCLACTSLFFQAKVSRSAAQASVQMTVFSRKAAQAYKAEIGARLDGAPLDGTDSIDHPDVRGYVGAFDQRLIALAQSRWISGVMIATMLALVVLLLGIDIFERGTDWEILLVYLVAARFALTSVQSLLVGLTSINRFYPKLQSYRGFQSRQADLQDSQAS